MVIDGNGAGGSANVTISNSTISGNDRVGVYAYDTYDDGSPPVVTLESTIVGDNAEDLRKGSDFGYVDGIINASFSLIENNFDAINGTNVSNITGVDPQLDPAGLQDNGGPTPTIALQATSPAIDAGSNPNSLTYDQRGVGFPREEGGVANIGAIELYAGDTGPTEKLQSRQRRTDFVARVAKVDGRHIAIDRPLPFAIRTAWQPTVRSLSTNVTEVHIRAMES